MRIALFSDIHANREALDACLAHAAAIGVEAHVFLGDYVGYGPDPVYVTERLAELVGRGAIAVIGNHDKAALSSTASGMSENAARAIDWTRTRLDAASRSFLGGLPLSVAADDRLYVHASARDPGRWIYVDNRTAAADGLAATEARLVFSGHTHIPAIYHALAAREPACFRPLPFKPMPFSRARRYVCIIGAVGQPRDHNPAACWSLLDTTSDELTMMRIGYDIDATVRKIKDAGLPEWLGRRLYEGR